MTENPAMNHDTEKKAVRASIRAARASMDTRTRAELGDKLAGTVLGYLAQSTGIVRKVAAYTSSPGEPDTAKLLDAMVDEGIEVFLPVCEPGFALSWAAYVPGIEFQRSTLAPVMEPVGPRLGTQLFDDINTLIIPALAIDEQGLRLGQGGGYYDRFLPLIEDSPVRVAAIVYDNEFVPAGTFPVAEHDQPVDLVFTPAQVHQII
ncbi:5-formyltetrahydrofolate cyclo-ligase [Glutamicibacter halophytocola]|uniref:5-formyltetrahydrofolate cyclo-ligase n=1 Tax=Glutamicibacter halophytocola TaxID=1933880 RepID=A0AA95BP86_9MICC|nr:5-formyltetrahydrofolate cyclo-ligase [Glutamicibacter halophytocola]UUX57910.1 5-formyltetrahydrofolate cyclo-ligase [Glutamicibacter halophytocola]